MAQSQLQRQVTGDFNLEKVQDYVEQQIRTQSQRTPIMDGRQVSAVQLTGSASQVAHGLGRVPLGWFVTGQNANAVVWESTARTKEFLNLQASASVTVDLWVY